MVSWSNDASESNGASWHRIASRVGLGWLAGGLLLCFVCLGGAAAASPADDQYAVAAGHYAKKHWKLAAEEFEVFLEKHPDHPRGPQSVFFLAEALLQTGATEQAEGRFREYLEREPKGKYAVAALFRAGETAYLLGQTAAAQADLQRFATEYPDDKLNAYALPYLGDLAMGEGKHEVAAEFFRDGLKRFPEGPLLDDCRFGLARAQERLQQLDEAEELYEQVVSTEGSPLADKARFHLGALQFLRGRFDAVLETLSPFETNLAGSPWKSKAQLTQGWALMKLKRPDEAAALFGSAAEDADLAVEAKYWLGLAQREKGQWQVAAETLAAAAELDPKHHLLAAIRYYAGDSLLQAGDPNGAAERFDSVLSMGGDDNPWLDDAACGKIRVSLQTRNHESLEQEASAFHKRFPDSELRGQVDRMLARSLVEQRKFSEAATLLAPMIAAADAGTEALENRYLLAAAQEGLGRHEEALATLAPVLEQSDGKLKADAQLVAGSSLLALKRYAEAIAPLEAFLAGKPAGDAAIRARGGLAVAQARTGKLEESKALFDDLVAEQADHALLPTVAEQLGEAAYAAGNTEWALSLFQWLSQQGREPEERRRGLSGAAWSSYKLGKLPEAANLFAQLLESKPAAPMAAEAALARGRILEELGQLDAALAMFDQVVEDRAEDKVKEYPLALLAAARLRRRLDQHRQSADLYKRLAEQFPDLPDRDTVLYEWSWVLFDQGEAEASNALLAKLRAEHSRSRYWADATYRLAVRGFQAKDYPAAAKLCSEIIESDTQGELREHALYLLARIAAAEAERDGKWELVREHFERLLAAFPNTPTRLVAEFWIAESLYRQQKFAESLEAFDQLAQQTQGQPGDWLAMIPLRRSQLLAHQRKWTEAYAIASKIEQQFPGFQQQYEADYVAGRCLAALADFDGARVAYEKVIHSEQGAKTETAAMAQWMIGETYFHQKQYDVAMREYLRVARLYAYPKWQAGALLQGAKCRELLGEPEEAAKLYAEVLADYADTPFAEQAKERLEAARSGRPQSPPPSTSEN